VQVRNLQCDHPVRATPVDIGCPPGRHLRVEPPASSQVECTEYTAGGKYTDYTVRREWIDTERAPVAGVIHPLSDDEVPPTRAIFRQQRYAAHSFLARN
jgi:hypothetical protein